MSDKPEPDIQQLLAGLNKPGGPKPLRPRPKPPAPTLMERVILLAGLVALISGIGYLALNIYHDVTTGEVPEAARIPSVPDPNPPPGASPGTQALATSVFGGGDSAPLSLKRDAAALSRFDIDLNSSAFMPPARLTLRPDGQPFTVYCVMFASLDPETESAWKQSGMLKEESSMLSPFLRKVTVRNQETLENVIDWHVESVTLTAPKIKPL
jgi:hypothetical protein